MPLRQSTGAVSIHVAVRRVSRPVVRPNRRSLNGHCHVWTRLQLRGNDEGAYPFALPPSRWRVANLIAPTARWALTVPLARVQPAFVVSRLVPEVVLYFSCGLRRAGCEPAETAHPTALISVRPGGGRVWRALGQCRCPANAVEDQPDGSFDLA